MNLDRSLIFSYLEEDNIQRAYFRVRPLLSLDGDIQQEALQLWPNEGGLRIVPDRNEQHTFKVRMRKLGAFCVIDLRGQPADAGKIRTNKNFKPERGEVNQYILYSDTVHELPEHTYYQLLEGKAEDFEALSKEAVTPLFFIREDDTLYGPIHKEGAVQPEPAQEAAAVMFEVTCPDGVTRSILCIEDEPVAEKAAPVQEEAEKAVEAAAESPAPEADAKPEEKQSETSQIADQPEELPIGQTLQILDQHQDHEETLRQLDKPVSEGANLLRHKTPEAPVPPQQSAKNEPLTGTPLVRTPLHVSSQQNKNHTQEIVSSQWSVGKYEPPAQNLPEGTTMRAVANPVQTACDALRSAWLSDASHEQLLDFILSLDGLRSKLETKLGAGENVTAMQRVLRSRLQDLEAERLTALCELDRARRDADAYKQEVVSSISARLNRETSQLEANKESAQSQLEALKAEVNALTLQKDGLWAKVQELQSSTLPEAFAHIAAEMQMTAPMNGVPLRMSPVSGQHADAEQLIERLMNIFAGSDYPIDRNTAVAILVLLAISPRIGISSPATAALATLIRNIAIGFGWRSAYAHQFSPEQLPMVGARPVDSTPAILATNLPNYAPIVGATKLTISRNPQNLTRNAAYDVEQWPILVLPALPFIPALESSGENPISAASLVEFAAKSSVSDDELNAILKPVLDAAIPLNGASRAALFRFVSVCADMMEGGLPVAADWGILLWVIPNIERGGRYHQGVKAKLDEFPLSLAKL